MKKTLTYMAKTIVILMAVLLLVLLGVFFWIGSNHNLKWLETKINTIISGQIDVESYSVTLFPLQIHIDDAVFLDGNETPLAGFSHLYVRVDIRSLLKKEIVLETVVLESPWADATVGENGEVDIVVAATPVDLKQKSSDGKTGTSFNVVFQSVAVTDGRFSLKKADETLQIETSGIKASADGDLMERAVNIDLEVQYLRFATSGFHPEPARLELIAQLDGDDLRVPELNLTSALTDLHLSGMVAELFSQINMDATISAKSQLSELEKHFDINGNYQGPITTEVNVKGKLENPEATLAVQIGKGKIAGQAVDHANFLLALQDKKVDIKEATWRLAGGSVALAGTIDMQETFPSALFAAPENMETIAYTLDLVSDIPDLHPWLETHTKLKGTATFGASIVGKGIVWPNLFATVSMEASAQDLIAPGMDRSIVADATLKCQIDKDRIGLSHLEIGAGSARLAGEGHIQMEKGTIDGNFSFSADELSRILTVVGIPYVSGSLDTSMIAGGTLGDPHLYASLVSKGLKLNNYTIGDIDTTVRLEKETLSVDHLTLSNTDSVLSAAGNIQLFAPGSVFKPVKDPQFDVTLASDHFDPKHFIDSISGDFTLKGSLSGNISMPTGDIALTGKQIDLFGQTIQSITFDTRIEKGRLWLDKVLAELVPGEQLRGGGWLDMKQTMDLQLRSDSIDLSHIQLLSDIFPGGGLLELDVSAKGDLQNPDIDGRLTVTEIVVNGEPMDDINLHVSLKEMQAKAVGNLNFDINADYDVKKGDFNANFLFDQTETQGYFKAAGIQNINGTLSGHVKADGNVNRVDQIAADMDLKDIGLFHKGQTLLRSEHLAARLEGSKLSIPEFEMELLSSGYVKVKGEADLGDSLDFTADGRIPIAAAAPFSALLTEAKGFITFKGSLSGKPDSARYNARIDLENIKVTVPELAQRLHGLNGAVVLTPEMIQFKELKGFLDTGSFMITGSIGHDNFQPSDFDVTLQARSLPIELPETLTVLTNSNIRIKGENRRAKATGEIVLLEGVYYKDIHINLLNMASSATTRRRAEPVASKPLELPYMETVDLDIALRHRQPFEVQNNLAELAIRPDLRIRGTLAKPIINGRAQVSEGIITFQRKEFTVKKGVIDFVDPYQTKADIDIESEARIRDWTVNLAIKGTMDDLVFTLTSVPSETEADILSLILFGRTTRELSGGEGGSSRTTNQIIAEMISDTFSDDIKKNTGIDILELETTDGSDDSNENGVKVTVGKHLSDRMTVKYAVETTDGVSKQWAIMEYKLLERILVNGSQSTNGLFGGELIYRIEFR